METWVACVFGLMLCGCGGAEQAPDANGVRRFTLSGEIGATQGVVLETGSIVDVTWDDIGESDIYLPMAMMMMLNGVSDNAFCAKGEGFASVADIPAEPDTCEWKYLGLSGNAPDLQRGVEADGYLFFDADQDRIHRLLIVEHSIDADHVGKVTFDLLAVD